jgi:hypothetical protein
MKPMFFGIAGLTTFLALIPATISPRTFFTTAQTAPAELVPEAQTERFKIRLTLSSSTDLKVREGDEITKGEVLADRTRDRTRLDAQRRQIQLRIAQLKQPIAAPLSAKPIPEVAALPPTSFLDEAAKVSQATGVAVGMIQGTRHTRQMNESDRQLASATSALRKSERLNLKTDELRSDLMTLASQLQTLKAENDQLKGLAVKMDSAYKTLQNHVWGVKSG